MNQRVDVIDEYNAVGSSCAVVFREPSPQPDVLSSRVTPRSVVEYSDKYSRTAQGWRIASRTYRINFMQEEEGRRPIG